MSTIMITEIMERHIKSMCSEYGSYIVKKLSEKYGFDAEEASREVELPSVVKRVDIAPRRKDVTEKKPKAAAKAEKAPVPSIPLPFCGKAVDGWCLAIVKNKNLYTQCTNTPSSDDGLCKKCVKLVENDGELPFGLITGRLECDTYKDPKGNSPISYAAVMAKMNITREAAEAEAAKFGLTIPEEQFVVAEKSRGRPKNKKDEAAENLDDENSEKNEKKRGRPKKDKPMKATSKVGDDIIAGLLSQAKANGEIEDDADSTQSSSNSGNDEETSEAETVVEPKAAEKKPKQSAEEKAAAKEASKAAKEAEKSAAKAAKEAEKAAAKAAKEAEKTAKTAAKEAEKHKKATKAAEKKADVPTVAAVAAVADPKPIAGDVAETKPSTQDEASCEEEEYSEDEDEEDEKEVEEIKVKKFEHGGKKYKRSEPDNILYDWETDEPVGVWNEKTNEIDELPSESEEEDDE